MRKTAHVVVPLVLLLVGAVLFAAACSGAGDEEAAAPPAEAGLAGDAAVSEDASALAPAEPAGLPAEPAEPPAEPVAAPPAEAAPPALEEDLLGVEPLPVQPRVIQNATLSVTVPKGDFEETIDRARQIAATLGGFVTSSQSSQGPDQRLVRGAIVVRVPGEAYPQAMSQFARLGKVVGRQETGTDVSLQYVDLEARASHLEAVERQLLGFLNQTETVADALVVQQRLNKVQLQLEEIEGQLRYLDDQTSFATISLEVAERGVPVAKPAEKDGGWTLGDAWGAAVNGIEKIAGGLLVFLVTAGPILAALALAFLAGRALLRRRRPAPPGPVPPAGSPSA
jgi:hypothetical protein